MAKRRVHRATELRESNDYPGYIKYEITIREKDGSLTGPIPAYGKDLQDALSRFVYVERQEKIERKYPWLLDLGAVLVWLGTMSAAISYVIANQLTLWQSLPLLVVGPSTLLLLVGWISARTRKFRK